MFCGLRKWFVLLVVVCMMAFAYQSTHSYPNINDSTEYLFATHNILENNTLYSGDLQEPIDFRLFSKRTFGYPLYLLFQTDSTTLTVVSQIGFFLLNYVLCLFILRRFRVKKLTYLVFSIFFCLTPIAYFHSFFILADLLLMTIVTTLTTLVLETKLSRNREVFLFAFLWGVSLAVKPVILPSLLLLPIMWAYLFKRKRKGKLFLIVPVLFWLVIGLINYTNTHQFETSSISTINLTQYNAKLTIASRYGYDSAQKYTENKALIIPQNKSEYSLYKKTVKQLGINTLLENLGTYVKVHLMGIAKMLVDPGRFEIYTFFGEDTASLSLTEMFFDGSYSDIKSVLMRRPFLFLFFVFLLIINVFKLLGFIGIIKKTQWPHLLILSIIAYFLLLTGPIGAARFFLPVTPLYLVLVSVGWSNFFQKSSKS